MVVQLAILMVADFAIALSSYMSDAVGALTGLFWFAAFLISLAALATLLTGSDWLPPVLMAEALAILGSVYVLWAELSSPYRDDWLLIGVATVVLVVAVPTFLALTRRAPGIPGKVWSVVLALVTALGLTQFVMENQVLPNRTRPKVSVQAELSEVWHSRNHIRVRGVVTWKNEGLAEVKMPAAFAVVTATGRLAGPTTALDFSDVASTLTPTVADARPYEHAPTSPRGSGIIWFDDLTPVTSLLPPGTGTQRTFLLTVDRRKVRQLDLTVSTTLLTSARFGVPETCDQAYDANDPNFLEQARKPWTGGGWTYSCVRVPFSGRNLVLDSDRRRLRFDRWLRVRRSPDQSSSDHSTSTSPAIRTWPTSTSCMQRAIASRRATLPLSSGPTTCSRFRAARPNDGQPQRLTTRPLRGVEGPSHTLRSVGRVGLEPTTQGL